MRRKGRTVGLALGGGAARGTAHLGVLRALRDLDFPVDVVAGTSIGALVGGVYASGNIDRLEEAFLHLDWKEVLYHFLDVTFPRSGLVDGKHVVEFISEFISPVEIGDLPIPFRAVATDVMSGAEVVLSDGRLIESIRASIAMPGIFTPVEYKGRVLVDGGLVNPVPVNVVRDMGADFVIAVDINSNRVGAKASPRPRPKRDGEKDASRKDEADADWRNRITAAINARFEQIDRSIKEGINKIRKSGKQPNIFDVIGNTIRIMEAQIGETQLQLTRPDLLIRPDVGDISFMEFTRAREGIEAGYAAAYPLLEAARKRLKR